MKTYIQKTKKPIIVGKTKIKTGTPIHVSEVIDNEYVVHFTQPNWIAIPIDYMGEVVEQFTK